MAPDLLRDTKRSPKVLKELLEQTAKKIRLPLPDSAKIFLAVARLQKFDVLPKPVDKTEMDGHLVNGFLELNRGLTATPGVTTSFYGRQLVYGTYYPGTLTAHGHGIYFAEPSLLPGPSDTMSAFLPCLSVVAERYASGEIGGVIMRASLKPKARTVSQDELFAVFREDRNRAARAGITDLGTYAAAIGYDAIFIDGAFTYCQERMWVVLNRGELVVQKQELEYAGKEARPDGNPPPTDDLLRRRIT